VERTKSQYHAKCERRGRTDPKVFLSRSHPCLAGTSLPQQEGGLRLGEPGSLPAAARALAAAAAATTAEATATMTASTAAPPTTTTTT
jgi:hypothetical protein